MDIYKAGIRPLLFSGLKADPEWLHQQSLKVLQGLGTPGDWGDRKFVRQQLRRTFCFCAESLAQTHWGLSFPNPVGLAAGFDKDGAGVGIWEDFGFGFAELGTVTFHAQPGNPRPRLFRLMRDRAVLNRMGFNNAGAAALASRLRHQRAQGRLAIPIGINLGKSKITPLETAAMDYRDSFRLLRDLGDYFVVNVSSPNTPGLRSLQAADQLSQILDMLQSQNQGRSPLFVKIAPDLEDEAIAEVVRLAQEYQLAGLIATNTTIRREGLRTQVLEATGNLVTAEAGGLSGAPLRDRATEVIRFIWTQTQGTLPIIGVGGIFTAADAWEKITAGACLVQTYTGWIYEGPWMVRRILEGLTQRLNAAGLTHISEAIGCGHGRPSPKS
jgi:dihydroorotate dehydrogenase